MKKASKHEGTTAASAVRGWNQLLQASTLEDYLIAETFRVGLLLNGTRGSSMFTMTRTFSRALGSFLVAVGLLAVARTNSFARSIWPDDLHQPSIYIIEGCLDRGPKDAKVTDRIEISAAGKRRTLLVTRYGTPGETGLDRYPSRVMAKPFAIEGTPRGHQPPRRGAP